VATLLKGATVVDLEPATVELADLRIDGDRIVERATSLEVRQGEETIDVRGKILFPGLVSAHHHFSSLLLRGVTRPGAGFQAEQAMRRQLADLADHDQLAAVTEAGALEGLLSGVTSVFGVHQSNAHIEGSLQRVAHALNAVGLRTVLGCQVTERAGAPARDAAIEENLGHLARARGRYRGAMAVDSLASLSDEGLAAVREAHQRAGGMLLLNLAEDPLEEKQSNERFGATATERLVKAGLLGSKVVVAQGVHLSWPELSQLISAGTWLAHASRSNMASQTGLATPSKFGVRGCLATDVMPLDVFAEAQAAGLRATDSGQPIDLLRFLANGHRLVSEAFGVSVGPLQPGSVADILVLDYHPPTPLDARSLAGHVQFGITGRTIESVMVDGLWRLWKRKPLSVDAVGVAKASAEATRAVWKKLEA
jgi:cytosine/adenosine deaminase-related metal-dependent hydrolase